MTTATKEKIKAETSKGPSEENVFDTDIIETTDLENEERQIEKLKSKIQRLQGDFNQRQTNLEVNIKQLRRERDEKIAGLREQYNSCIGKGDAIGADRVMADIRKAHEDLTNTAHNVMDSDKDFSDLKKRGDELHLATGNLYKVSLSNFELAQSLMRKAAGLTGTMTQGIGSDVLKLERTIEETKKIAEQILKE